MKNIYILSFFNLPEDNIQIIHNGENILQNIKEKIGSELLICKDNRGRINFISWILTIKTFFFGPITDPYTEPNSYTSRFSGEILNKENIEFSSFTTESDLKKISRYMQGPNHCSLKKSNIEISILNLPFILLTCEAFEERRNGYESFLFKGFYNYELETISISNSFNNHKGDINLIQGNNNEYK